MQAKPLYQHIASLLIARQNCIANGNTEWESNHSSSLESLQDFLPSGSGFDSGTTIDIDTVEDSRGVPCIVLSTSYHHMNECGMYCGWSEHTVTIRPAFDGFDGERHPSGEIRSLKDHFVIGDGRCP